jgi:undecaprenyl-diphosphatase
MPDIEEQKQKISKIGKAVPDAAWVPLVISFVALIILVSAFASIAFSVTAHRTTAFDDAILNAIHLTASPQLDAVVKTLTLFGSLVGVVVLTAGAIISFASRRKWRRAAMLVVAVGGASALNLILKGIFARTRPDLWQHIVTENSYSFPSGHAMASMGLAAGLVVALWNTSYRRVALIAGSAYVIVIAFTRLYLGVHFPTDIIAGWLVSIAWVVIVKLLFSYRFRRKIPGVEE